MHLVDSLDSAQDFLRWAGERRPDALALDTETDGLHWWKPEFLRMVQIGDQQQGWSIPSHLWGGVIRDFLVRYTGRLSFWNAKHDLHALESAGFVIPEWRRVDDGFVMDHLLGRGRSHALKTVASRELGVEARAGQSLLKQDFHKHGWTWGTVPYDHPTYWAYAAMDTVLTARLVEGHKVLLLPMQQEQYDREMAVLEILYDAEKRGMLVDVDYTSALKAEWIEEMAVLQAQLEELGINSPNSNADIEAALFAKDPDWEPEEWTDSGQIKLDKDVLIKLGNEIGTAVLRYRRLRKWSKAYLDAFLSMRDKGDRLHPSIKTLGARTGRMSIVDPPLQTLPRGNEIRNCIIPAEGNRLVAVDYDTMEYRVLAHYADAGIIKDAIMQKIDLHRLTASLAYGIEMEEVSKQQRQISKNSAYGRLYGAGAAKIAVTASAPDTDGSFTIVTEEEVANFLARFDANLPEVSTLMQRLEAVEKQRLATEGEAWVRTVGGRRVPVDSDRLYAGLNYLIQGSCADIFKTKLIEIANAGLDGYLILPVHDEGLFEIPEMEIDDVVPELERIMLDDTTYSIPLTVGASAPMCRWGK